MSPVDLTVVREMRNAALAEAKHLRLATPATTGDSQPEGPHPGVFTPVGCPNCHNPNEGGSPMRLIDHMDATHIPHRWRRAILECVTCHHGVLIDITLADLDNPNAT